MALTLAACVAVQAAPAAAEGEPETGAFGAFRLKGTNGYSIFVLAVSRPQFKHGETLVVVGRRGDAAIYFAPAKVTATTIDADLGPVGEIAVEFQPSGPPERVHARCKGVGSVTYEPGAWVGTIALEGEEGFTQVHRERAKAAVSPFVDAGCGGKAIGEAVGSDVPGARLVALSATKRQAVYLQANKNHRGARVYLEASIDERRPGLVVSREVAGYFPSGAFEFGAPLRTATLAPSGHFAGHATFRRDAKPANRWTGNLSVDFPGNADVALAGRGFKAGLVHAKRTERTTFHDRLARVGPPGWPSLNLSLGGAIADLPPPK
ncbi:MAG: hypothetical protein QOF06_2668 [Solirubrobacterales bacterium]|nr:hypothetical protein [Solirubrobacterales bacterium]